MYSLELIIVHWGKQNFKTGASIFIYIILTYFYVTVKNDHTYVLSFMGAQVFKWLICCKNLL